ncbi:MAG TPA: 5'/3'-nucleotidase SurE, partial [Terriglobia bacterium]|nr:5'/3'-nucleotidase SurE [Terriglobia bacterium]
MQQILITNDDGIDSPALGALEIALSALGRVTVVAPDGERSAASHS